MFKKSSKAFTLTEMMVVIAVLAILSAILIPNILNAMKISRFSKAKHFAKDVADAAEIYQAITGQFPADITSLTGATPPFMTPEVVERYCNPDPTLTKIIDGYGHVCMFNLTAGADTFAYYSYIDEVDGSGFYLLGLYLSGPNSGKYLTNETNP